MTQGNLQPFSGKGFIISRHSFDQAQQAIIELWVVTDTQRVKLKITDEQPVFFIEQSNFLAVKQLFKTQNFWYSIRPLSMYNFAEQQIAGIYFKNISDSFKARDLLSENSIQLYEANIRLTERFLMERFINAGIEFIGYESLHNDVVTIENAKIKPTDYQPELRVLSLDIECSPSGELYSVGLYAGSKVGITQSVDNPTDMLNEAISNSLTYKKVIMRGEQETAEFQLNLQPKSKTDIRANNQQKDPLDECLKEINYIDWVTSEKDILLTLEATIQQIDPDIIIGWNVIDFDFRLLARRAKHHNLQLRIGRGKCHFQWIESRVDKGQGYIQLPGRKVIDGITALKAEAYFFPSFSLESMAQHFLGVGKKTENANDRLDEIVYNFKFNKIKLAEYNLQDCILVWEIFAQTRLLEFLIFRSQLTGLELDRAGGSVAAFTHLYLPRLHRYGYVSPNLPDSGGLMSPGGYVMDSKPGLYQQVLVLDYKSLYPSIIRTFKIDPLGLIAGLKEPADAIEGFRGACFSRDKNILPKLIEHLWSQRDIAKAEKDLARSQAIKILMNSFYGVLGSGGCAFYDSRLASSITLRGHAIMKQTAQWIRDLGFAVIYGDTDSTFVLLGNTVSNQQAQDIGHQIAQTINQLWRQHLAEDYQLACYLEIEFESHFTRFLMPTIRGSEKGSKKRYAGLKNIANKTELVFKGLENVRSDWTELAKMFQRELYQLLFSDKDPCEFIRRRVEEILNGQYDEQLVYRKRLGRPLAAYQKNIPPHVKAARMADAENKRLNKPLNYQNRGIIAYVMTLNGPEPVEYQKSSIDYQHYIDKQIEPVADGILPFTGLSFAQIIKSQLGLFDE
ncbi:DNA polymerase II [Aliikangiella maris]|uniref:DNA polymerase n=2 Tax=Aliikangiella maris TaxID=3162458 RepID=A0ABV2BUJ6_9GAMM